MTSSRWRWIGRVTRRFTSDRLDLVWLVVAELGLNGLIWVGRAFWYPFTPVIALAAGVIGFVNTGLAILFARKAPLISQLLVVTALIAQLLILILIVRTGVFL
jgi:hypothetical protein